MSQPDEYYILDTRCCVGNCGLWWGPDSNGYVCEIVKAGVYTRAEAERITCPGRGTDRAYLKSEIDRLVIGHVRIDHIHELEILSKEAL